MAEVTERGLVLKSTGKWYIVRPDAGPDLRCSLAGRFRTHGLRSTNPVAVGDRVLFRRDNDSEGLGAIVTIEVRKNHIVRKATRLSSNSHVLAANIDQAILVITPSQPRTSTGFIDRFLVSANAFDIPVILVFNKIDLYSKAEIEYVDALIELYQQIGHRCHRTSAITGSGTDWLKAVMHEKVSMIAGHSGTGKSALINAIEPGLRLRTGEISDFNLKGRHTTTFAEMHPLSFGGYIADTPGIKEFGISSIEKNEIAGFFPEFFALLNQCRFYNCTHLHEPGCAVKESVDNQSISPSRYKSYLSIMKGEEFDDDYD